MKKIIIFIVINFCSIVYCAEDVRYKIIRIDPPPDPYFSSVITAIDINNNGEIIGSWSSSDPNSITFRPFYYSRKTGSMEISIPRKTEVEAVSINDSGQILLTAFPDDFGFYSSYKYTPGVGIELLGNFGYGGDIIMYGINNRGDVVGVYNDCCNEWPVRQNNGESILENLIVRMPITKGSALSINDNGWIVGEYNTLNNEYKAFLYSDVFGMIDIGSGSGIDINNNGVALISDNDSRLRYPDGSIKLIENLGDQFTFPISINDFNVVVGTAIAIYYPQKAIIWDELEGIKDLNQYIEQESKYILTVARSINNKGQIVGEALFYYNNSAQTNSFLSQGGVLLDPIPPKLDIKYEGTNVVVSWSPNWPGLFLEQADSLGTTNWTAVSQSGTNVIILPKTDKQQFFRLNIQAGRGLFWGP